MDSQIYISTLVYKKIVRHDENICENIYKVLGPMMGTIDDNKVFLNTHDRSYLSIENPKMNADNNIRYAYYNLISLKDLKNKYKTDNVERVIAKYLDEFKDVSYYVITNATAPIIIAFDENKMKRKYESDIAKPI